MLRSIIMVDPLAGDRNPRLLALLIDRIFGNETVSGLKISERDRIGLMIGPRAVPDARTAGAAKEEVGGVAAVAGILPHLRARLALNADLLGRKAHLRRKGAPAPRLALAAMAHRHTDRLAGADDADLSATAGSVAGGGGHSAKTMGSPLIVNGPSALAKTQLALPSVLARVTSSTEPIWGSMIR